MKRIFFTCCIISACFSAALAQNATQSQMKSDLAAKVGQLHGFIAANDNTHATSTFAEIKQMMEQELAATKQEIAGASSDAEKTADNTKMRRQYILYRQVMADVHDGITSNTASLNTHLQGFVDSY
jgi:hypothetical protein